MEIQAFSPAVKGLLSDRPQLLTVCTNQRSAIAPKSVAGAMRLSRLSLDFQSKRDAWGRGSIRNCRRPHIEEMQRSATKKSLGLRSQSWQDIQTGLIQHPEIRWLLYRTR